MPDTPLNSDALNELGVERAQDAYGDAILNRWWPRKTVIRIIRAYLAVAQPEVNSVEELAKAWYVGFCKGEQTAFSELPVNPDTINPYKNGETP